MSKVLLLLLHFAYVHVVNDAVAVVNVSVAAVNVRSTSCIEVAVVASVIITSLTFFFSL